MVEYIIGPYVVCILLNLSNKSKPSFPMCMVPKGGRAEEDTMVAIFPLIRIESAILLN